MPERGGSTTQSGILYQNSITARYLGRMLNKFYFPPSERVTSVRGEAPKHVDDVVVTFEDGHRDYIQAKEHLAPGSSPWKKVWKDFDEQRNEPDFKEGDRLVLFLGETINKKRELDELSLRAQGALHPAEWMKSIETKSGVYVKELEKLVPLLEHRDDESIWRLMRVVEIWVEEWNQLKDNSLNWMPPSSVNNKILFTTLRDLSGEEARIKGSFDEAELRRRLENEYGIQIEMLRAEVDGKARPLTSEELTDLEEKYRQRIKARYAEEADYYVELAGETAEAAPVQDEGQSKAPRAARRIRSKAAAEYHEWIPAGKGIRKVKINNLRKGVEKYTSIVLLGDPGSGKTTALENLAYQFADEANLLPLPMRLREFKPGKSLDEFIILGWGGTLEANHWGMPDLAANLKGYLEEGKLFFLFDALNEMPREEYHQHSQELRDFIDRWIPKGNRFMVTCRKLDYGEELSGLQRIEVQPLNDDQIRKFLRNELPEDWRDLWGELAEAGEGENRLLEMARNPYLLTMMIDVYFEDCQLYHNRAALLARFTQILIEWVKEKTPPEQWLEAEVQGESLAMLAYEMQDRSGSGSAVKTSLVKTVMPQEVEINPDYPAVPSPPDQILNLAASANILEMPSDRSSVRFYHQLLQEYFAARQLLKRDPAGLANLWEWPWPEEDMPTWERPEKNYDPLPPPPPTGWEETTILASGLAAENDDQLVRALLQVNPVLAGRCLYEGKAEVDKAVRQAVIHRLLETIATPEVALRVRIAAGEALGYLGDPRLGEMVNVSGGEFLMGDDEGDDYEKPQHKLKLPSYQFGKYPVTNAEYQRFVEAGGYNDQRWWTKAGWRKKEEREWTEPRWDDSFFNKPNQPVVGVTWYECVAYCTWLSAETGLQYRLPTEAEWEKAARGVDGRQYPWGE